MNEIETDEKSDEIYGREIAEIKLEIENDEGEMITIPIIGHLMNELESKLGKGNYRRIANEIAATCGENISEHTVGNVLNGRRNPSFRVAQMIAGVVGCTMEELTEYIESNRAKTRSAA